MWGGGVCVYTWWGNVCVCVVMGGGREDVGVLGVVGRMRVW